MLAHELHRRGVAALDGGVAFETLDLSAVRRALAALRRTAPADVEAAAAAVEQALAALATAAVI